jgi:hypothetical protein
MKKPVPISDEEAYDSSRWTHKHDDLVKHIIDQIGHPDQHLDAIVHEPAGQIGPMRNCARHCWSATHNNTWTTSLGGALRQRARW